MKIDFKDIVDIIKDSIKEGKDVTFSPMGNSMLPTIKEKDTVILTSPNDLKVFDIVLYFNNDQYLLHRIVKIHKDDTLDIAGDNNVYIEKNIPIKNVIAKVKSYNDIDIENPAFYKQGKKIKRIRLKRKIFRY